MSELTIEQRVAAGLARVVPLTRGRVALVDADDYEAVVAVGSWQARMSHGIWYAARTMRAGGRERHAKLHSWLTGWPLTDHINGNGLDNRRENLRPATTSQNAMNRRLPRTNTSGFKGVSFHKDRGRFQAYIKAGGRMRYLGLHDTAEAAALAYDMAAAEAFGEFARLNFPDRLIESRRAEVE